MAQKWEQDWFAFIDKIIGTRKIRFSQLVRDITKWQEAQGGDPFPTVTAIMIKRAMDTGRLKVLDDDSVDPKLERRFITLKDLARERLVRKVNEICDDENYFDEVVKLARRLYVDFDDNSTRKEICQKVKDRVYTIFT